MKQFLIGALMAGLLGTGLSILSPMPAEAGGCPACPTCPSTKTIEDGHIRGEMVCPSCVLKKEQGAKAQCSIYGCPLALRLDDGQILTLLENDQSTELVRNKAKYNGKKVEIKGRIFPNTQIIEVESFKVIP
ncbi:MAG: hypothetical protein DDT32_01784 [Syntrophomonadaceae bacterium]|nr:hypothetical protein [Bacillota bacterium]MBT9148015.1 hypothetical protein [Bacillota bacterium]